MSPINLSRWTFKALKSDSRMSTVRSLQAGVALNVRALVGTDAARKTVVGRALIILGENMADVCTVVRNFVGG